MEYLINLRYRIPKDMKRLFGTSFLICLIVHCFIFTNKLTNWDDVGNYFANGWFISFGRWLLKSNLFSFGYSMPWLFGCVTSILLALAVCIVVSLLKIKSVFLRIICAFLMCSFPTITASFFYMNIGDSYILALMLACLAAYITRQFRFGWIVGSILIACSMGIYQAYFALAAGLLILSLLLDELYNDLMVKAFVVNCLQSILALSLGVIQYFLILKIALNFSGIHLSSYAGINSMGKLSVSNFISRFLGTYKLYWDFFTLKFLNIFDPWVKWLFMAMLFLLIFALFTQIINLKLVQKPFQLTLVVILVLIFPFACAIQRLMAGEHVHWVMLYSFVLTPLASLAFCEKIFSSQKAKNNTQIDRFQMNIANVLALICVVIAGVFVLTDNQAYFTSYTLLEQLKVYYTKLSERIEMTYGYNSEIPVAFIGDLNTQTSSILLSTPKKLDNLTGLGTKYDYLSIYSSKGFFQNIIGMPIIYADDRQIDQLENSQSVWNMPVYPSVGSLKMINGVLVVKYSNTSNNYTINEDLSGNLVLPDGYQKIQSNNVNLIMDSKVYDPQRIIIPESDNMYNCVELAGKLTDDTIYHLQIDSIDILAGKPVQVYVMLYNKSDNVVFAKATFDIREAHQYNFYFLVPKNVSTTSLVIYSGLQGKAEEKSIALNNVRLNVYAIPTDYSE